MPLTARRLVPAIFLPRSPSTCPIYPTRRASSSTRCSTRRPASPSRTGTSSNETDSYRPWNYEHPPTAKWILWLAYEAGGRPLHALNATERGDVCRPQPEGADPQCAPFVRAFHLPGAFPAAPALAWFYHPVVASEPIARDRMEAISNRIPWMDLPFR